MYKNYLRIALRNIYKYKLQSILNITGLACGMACCILILFYVQDELQYDKHHINASNIYRVVMDKAADGQIEKKAAIAYPAGPALAETMPEVLAATRLYKAFQSNPSIRYEETLFYEEKFFFADSNIFEVFQFDFVHGEANDALTAPNTIVINETIARKYFANANAPNGYDNPVGRALYLNLWELDDEPFQITGVCKSWPETSHMKWDLLATFANYHQSTGNGDHAISWYWDMFWTYVLLPDADSATKLTAKLPQFVELNYPDLIKNDITLTLQPLTNIHLDSHRIYEMEANSKRSNLYIFLVVAIAVIAIACINFVNLATSRAMDRAREVGIRKVLGAQRFQLIFQFLGEAFMMTFAAFLVALMLVELSLPLFNELTGKALLISTPANVALLFKCVLFVSFIALLAGGYPAFHMSGFLPITAFRNQFLGTGQSKGAIRKILVVTQFAITISLLIVTFVIIDQLNFIYNKDLGFEKEQVVLIPIRGTNAQEHFQTFRTELNQHEAILSATHTNYILGEKIPANPVRPTGMQLTEPFQIPRLSVDFGFLETFDIQLIAGRDFSESFSTDRSEAVILNESAVKRIGWSLTDPDKSPLGKQLEIGDRNPRTYTIVGVVKDFHHASLHDELEPLILRLVFRYPGYIAARLDGDQLQAGMTFLRKKWDEKNPNQTLVYTFMDDEFDKRYKGESQLVNVFGYFSVLAIIIATLGMFGLSAYTTARRTKEIGIRKILGASISGVVMLLNREFLYMTVFANLIAWPLAFYWLDFWLDNFAYRTTMAFETFLFAAILAVSVSFLAVTIQAVKAAIANPVDALKYE